MRMSTPFQHLNMTQSHSHMLCITYSWLTVYKELYSVENSVHLHYTCKVALPTLNGTVNSQSNLYWYPLHEIASYDLKVRKMSFFMHRNAMVHGTNFSMVALEETVGKWLITHAMWPSNLHI